MIVIQGFVRTAPENANKLKDAASALIAATRNEAGCIAYAFAEDIGEPGLFHIVERWSDSVAHAAHGQTPHLATFMGALPSVGVIGARIALYDAPSERVVVGA